MLDRWVLVQLIVTLVAIGAAYYDVESVIIAGPAAVLIGLIVFFTALRRGSFLGIILGASGIGIAGYIFWLINYWHWSPREAQGPVTEILMIYGGAFLLVYLLFSFLRR